MLLVAVLLAGCIPAPDMGPAIASENEARILGLPMQAQPPLTPSIGAVWPAAPTPTPTMLDMLAQAPSATSPRPTSSAAARGDFGLCLPTPSHLDSNGHQSTAPRGAALGIC